MKKNLKLNFSIFFKNKYIRSKNSYIIIKSYNLNIKRNYLSYDFFDHYSCFLKEKIFLYNILNYFFIENSVKNVKYYFKNYYFKDNIFNKVFNKYLLNIFKIKENKVNLLNIFFINIKENYNKYINYNYLKYNLSFNNNILKFNKYINLNFDQNLYILKNMFKFCYLKYKYLIFDLFRSLEYIDKKIKFDNNFLNYENQCILLINNVNLYNNILDLFNLNNFYIIYQLSIKYIKKLSYYFDIINKDLFIKFQYLFFKYNNYLKLNLHSLYYYKQIAFNIDNFVYKYKNEYVKEKNVFNNIRLLLNRIIYNFFLFFNKNFYFRKYLLLLNLNKINIIYRYNLFINNLKINKNNKIFINKFFIFFNNKFINRFIYFFNKILNKKVNNLKYMSNNIIDIVYNFIILFNLKFIKYFVIYIKKLYNDVFNINFKIIFIKYYIEYFKLYFKLYILKYFK
jgi:hypothetical protein